MHPAKYSIDKQDFIQHLLQKLLSRLSTSALQTIPFQGNLFIRNEALNQNDLDTKNFLILLYPGTNSRSIRRIERERALTHLCGAQYCLTQAGGMFGSKIKCSVADHPDLTRLLAQDRLDLIHHLAAYWAPIAIKVMAMQDSSCT